MPFSKTDQPPSAKRFPWWVSVLAAIISYCLLKYLVPELQPTGATWQQLVQAAPTFAPIVTIPFLLLAAKQLYDGDSAGDDADSPAREEEDQQE